MKKLLLFILMLCGIGFSQNHTTVTIEDNQTVTGTKTFSGGLSGNVTGNVTGSISGGTVSGSIVTSTGNFVGASSTVFCWNSDSGITRAAAAVFNIGTCTPGDASGLVKLTQIQQGVSNGVLALLDFNGCAHFFISGTAPYTNTFLGCGAGATFIGGHFNVTESVGTVSTDGGISLFTPTHTVISSLLNDGSGGVELVTNSGQIALLNNSGVFNINSASGGSGAAFTSGGTSGTTGGISIFTGQPGAANEVLAVYPADAASGATRIFALSVRSRSGGFLSGSQTWGVTNAGTETTTSPVINGTPSGTGIPTATLKTGSGAGNYTTASTTFVRADSTNLAFTVTIPTGWKLMIHASGSVSQATASGGVNVALADGSADNTGILVIGQASPGISGVDQFSPFALNWVLTGDGASHTINLQFLTGNGADSAILANSSSTIKPQMTFLLTPSN